MRSITDAPKMYSMLNQKALVGTTILLILFVTACSSLEIRDVVEITSRLAPTPSPSQTAFSTVVARPTNTQKPSITPILEPSSISIPIETPTIEPTVTLMITPVPPITNRQPSITELEGYLTELSLEEEPFGHVIELMHEDVNGDGEVDLVVSDYLFVGIFIWQGTHYEGSFIYQGYPWKYDPGSRVTLEDWTNDGIPEVIFDFRDDTGGTGVRITNWTRYIIHCKKNETACKVIWAGLLGSIYEGYGSGGVSLLQADVKLVSNEDDTLNLEVNTESFAVYSLGNILYSSHVGDGILSYSGGRESGGYPPFYSLKSLKVYTSTLDIFSWNGIEFEWQETQMLKPYVYTDSIAVLEATNNEGKTALITTKPNEDAGLSNDICQLIVDENATGLPFGCKNNFTIVKWQDVAGDDIEELVIMAYSGYYTDSGFEGEYLHPDIECIHQRVIIYQQENAQLKQIANVTGCVVQSDLYGIHFQDIDEDGQVEILAASGWFTAPRCWSRIPGPEEEQDNCWYEIGYQSEIYKWNGSEFIYWGTKE